MAIINLREGVTSTSSQDEVTIINNNVTSLALNDLTNVDATTGLANGKVIKYNSTNTRWQVADDNSVAAINDLSDVDTTGVANGKILVYNSTSGNFVIGDKSSVYTDSDAQAVVDLNTNGFITASSTSTLTNKSGNVSQFTNDSGYITGYTVTQSDVTAHQAALSITESQISDLSHYTNANAISAVEGESTLDLTGAVSIANSLTVESSNLTDIRRVSTTNNLGVQITKDRNDTGSLDDLRSTIGFAVANNTTTKYLGMLAVVDDSTDGKKFILRSLADDGSSGTDLLTVDTDKVFSGRRFKIQYASTDVTKPSGEFIVDADGLSGGNNQNRVAAFEVAKRSSNTTRRNRLDFKHIDSDDETVRYDVSLMARKNSSGQKQFEIQLYQDDRSALLGTPLVAQHDTSDGENSVTVTDRLFLNTTDTDTVPNSFRMTANMTGVSDTIHNYLNSIQNFGSNTIPDGAQSKYTFVASDDTLGERNVGALVAKYDSTEADNEIILQSTLYNGTPQGNISVNGSRLTSSVPFVAVSKTTTERNALTGQNGMIIYNTNTNRLEFYQNGAWVYYTATAV